MMGTRPAGWIAALLLAGVLAAACDATAAGTRPPPGPPSDAVAATASPPGDGPVGTETAPPAGGPSTEPSADADGEAGMIAPALQRVIDQATADLVARTGIPAGEITVALAEAVTWSDASLGCPHPDMRYAQVPTDGARVHLMAGGARYRYHAGGQRPEPFLCQEPAARPAPPARPLEPRLTDPPD